MNFEYYARKPASLVKHAVLESYLRELAYKVGQKYTAINYVEGFAGPWKPASDDLSDTSPHVAIAALRSAQQGLAERWGRKPRIRCAFIEKNRIAAQRLESSMTRYQGEDLQTLVLHGSFGKRATDLLNFVWQSRSGFTFAFIDPTAWHVPLEPARSLLEHRPGEVLINFMTSFVTRFKDDPAKAHALDELFGSTGYSAGWDGLESLDLEDAIVATYCRHVKELGGFRHVVSARVFDPKRNRTFYHLAYGTRSPVGLEVFRDIEFKGLAVQEQVRDWVRERRRTFGQPRLFGVGDIPFTPGYPRRVQARYQDRARQRAYEILKLTTRVPFDDLQEQILLLPMTRTKCLTDWLKEWRAAGLIDIRGLGPRQTTPRRGQNHVVTWNGSGPTDG